MGEFTSYLRAIRRARKLKRIRKRRLAATMDDLWERDEVFHLNRIEDLSATRKKEALWVCFSLTFLLSTTLTTALGGVGPLALIISYLIGAPILVCSAGGLHTTQWILKLHERKVSEINDDLALRGTSRKEISAV